ncbi:MAG: hypothetical protein ABJF10_13050 [Chthoniobacter sp.]|uniref:hypothetical protein n=1 Tax=Chthoniobacter sp. TaxID=2510640 RepID=UPI0032AA9AF0
MPFVLFVLFVLFMVSGPSPPRKLGRRAPGVGRDRKLNCPQVIGNSCLRRPINECLHEKHIAGKVRSVLPHLTFIDIISSGVSPLSSRLTPP